MRSDQKVKHTYASVVKSLMDMFLSKSLFWHCFNCLQAWLLISYSQELGYAINRFFLPCVTDDKD